MKNLALPALLAVSLLTPLAAHAGEPAPEDVDTIVKTDPRRDVRLIDGDHASAGAKSTTDIVKVTHVVDRSAQVLTTTIKVRDLTSAGRQLFAVIFSEKGGQQEGYVLGTRGRPRIDVVNGESGEERCPGGKLTTRWARDEVVLRVPLACVHLEEARLTSATATIANDAVTYDQGPRTRVVPFTAPPA